LGSGPEHEGSCSGPDPKAFFHMRVTLTFDDGPNGRYTSDILDSLKRHKVKACFFLLGENVEYYPDIAKRIKAEGHLIGNHTYSHRHLSRLGRKSITQQIELCEDAFKKILRLSPKFFRAPYGKYNDTAKRVIRQQGYQLIGWGPAADDYKNPSPDTIVNRIVSKTKDGSIILLHDGANCRHGESRRNTVKALPEIIKTLKEKGFRFVRLDKLCPGQKR